VEYDGKELGRGQDDKGGRERAPIANGSGKRYLDIKDYIGFR
jgi:hypothetical protein